MSELKCSFCQKERKKVKKLVQGPDDIYICNECVELSYGVLFNTKENETEEAEPKQVNLTPEQIKEKLDTHVVGQDQAKEVLSVAIYNHYKRINNPVVNDVEIEKSNIMLIGPSGCGKTLMVKTISKFLDLPFVIADSTSITEAGYVGQDVEAIFERLIAAADGDLEKAQKGIVFIDEIDKKTKKTDNTSKDVGGEGVQQALLKLVEGTTLYINADPGNKHNQTTAEFDTKDVLFICGGAFVGLDKVIEQRLQVGSTIGFSATLTAEDDNTNLQIVEPEDLHKFGFIREFVGRFPVTVSFHHLDEVLLERILTEPKNNLLSQYKGLFHLDGVALEFDDTYVKEVAKQSVKCKTGARGLRSIIEKSLTPIQFVLPRLSTEGVEKVVIKKSGIPEYIYKTQQEGKI